MARSGQEHGENHPHSEEKHNRQWTFLNEQLDRNRKQYHGSNEGVREHNRLIAEKAVIAKHLKEWEHSF